MTKNLREKLDGKEMKVFVIFSMLVLLFAAFVSGTPVRFLWG